MMRKTAITLVLVLFAFSTRVAQAQVSLQITPADTARLFGGTDAEGGIGDWYVSNGVVEAIIDNVGIQSDLTGIVPPGTEPPIQSEIADTGGTIIDLGRVGANDDQLPQMFTVGGLSTANFILYNSISAPSPGVIQANGKLLFPPFSVRPTPCIDIVTTYTAAGSDPFLTVSTTATNNCGVTLTGFGGFLDVFIWTLRGLVPFSGGGAGTGFGGFGFNHPVLDLSNPASSLEIPTFLAAPGLVRPADGIMDTANNTTSGEVSYGILPVDVVIDPDGAGPTPPNSPTPINALFGVSSTLVTALGNATVGSGLAPGASLTYDRHLYVAAKNDVESVSNPMLTELSGRLGFSTGTISGNVNAQFQPNVEASILVTRIGRCSLASSVSCDSSADCGAGQGTCKDPVVTPGQNAGITMTQIRTDSTGAFSGVVLPSGDYKLVVSSPERDDVVVRPVTVSAGNNTGVTIPNMTGLGTVNFTVRERRAPPGQPFLPAKLTFKGVNGSPDPQFHRDLKATLGGADIFPETFGGTQAGTSGHAAGQGNVVYTATGQGNIQVRPGTYDVYVSHGLEYGVGVQRINVGSGGTTNVAFHPIRVIKPQNAISADFHVHSGRSLDASAPLRDRVAAFAAEGVQVMVSTDHDKDVDYTPIISGFGLSSRLRSIIGEEVTGSVPNPPAFPNSIGHINGWPMPLNKDQTRDGAIEDEYVAPNFLFKRLRDQGAQVVQYNHPRAGTSGLTVIGIFNNIGCNRCANDIDMTCSVDTDCPVAGDQTCTCVGYQPDRVLSMPPNDILLDKGVLGPGSPANPDNIRNIDYDVMEIANGAKDTDFVSWRQVRRDWLSLINQGFYRPGTGVSDSHRITVEHAGWSRTYVNGAGTDPAALNVTAFDNQVKAGNMMFTSGPYVEFTAKATTGGATAGLGQLLESTDGKVQLKIKVRSAAWIPVEEVRVIANGFVVASFDSTTVPRVRPPSAKITGTATMRFNATVKMTVAQDTYFIVEAGAKLPADPNTAPTPPANMSVIEPDVVPEAMTNPIFVDRNGNSTFDPPGLPVLMASNTTEARPMFARVQIDATDPNGGRGVLDEIWSGLMRLASRFSTTTVTAQEVPGQMTGVTKEQKKESVKKGEYFPLREFALPPDAAEKAMQAEKAAEESTSQPAEPAAKPENN